MSFIFFEAAEEWLKRAERQVELWGSIRGRGQRYWAALDEIRSLRKSLIRSSNTRKKGG